MQRLEQEVKELQAGLGAVVQALNFLQTFIESDYGLKFQFHAYCTSPLYSHNSNCLEILKQKYGIITDVGYNQVRLFQHPLPQATATVTPVVQLRYTTQEPQRQELEASIISNCTVAPAPVAVTTAPNLVQTYETAVPVVTETDVISSTHSHHHHTSPIDGVQDTLSAGQRTSIIVNEEDIHMFGIGELSSMKEESHDIYQTNENEMDAFGKPEFEDENESAGEDLNNIQSHTVTETVAATGKRRNARGGGNVQTTKRGRARKDKVVEGYKCPHCRRRCPDKMKLEIHMAHHKQQFQCSDCGIWLADKSVLNRHMRTHTGDRPFSCQFCNEKFSRQDIVKKHIQRKHKGMLESLPIGGASASNGGVKYNKQSKQ